ncbi:hypothetical protein HK098_000289 [Nowakowskiella sp. JEL0407]|nr:hypothetical protein HK098_000289 [Nowakowskiella sp. JEL0407]
MAFSYPIVALYSAVYALLLAGAARGKLKVSLGDGTYQMIMEQLENNTDGEVKKQFNPESSRYFELMQTIRTHANYVENMPYILLMAFIAEANDAPRTTSILHGVLALFLVGRILHGIGLHGKNGQGVGRRIGIAITVVSYLVLGGLNALTLQDRYMKNK